MTATHSSVASSLHTDRSQIDGHDGILPSSVLLHSRSIIIPRIGACIANCYSDGLQVWRVGTRSKGRTNMKQLISIRTQSAIGRVYPMPDCDGQTSLCGSVQHDTETSSDTTDVTKQNFKCDLNETNVSVQHDTAHRLTSLQPLLAVTSAEPIDSSAPFRCTDVRLFSLKTCRFVHFIRFHDRILDVRSHPFAKHFVVALRSHVYVFHAATMQHAFSLPMYPSPRLDQIPISMGPRWLVLPAARIPPSYSSSHAPQTAGASQWHDIAKRVVSQAYYVTASSKTYASHASPYMSNVASTAYSLAGSALSAAATAAGDVAMAAREYIGMQLRTSKAGVDDNPNEDFLSGRLNDRVTDSSNVDTRNNVSFDTATDDITRNSTAAELLNSASDSVSKQSTRPAHTTVEGDPTLVLHARSEPTSNSSKARGKSSKTERTRRLMGGLSYAAPEENSEGSVIVIDMVTELPIAHLKLHHTPIMAMSVDLSGTLLATADSTGQSINVYRLFGFRQSDHATGGRINDVSVQYSRSSAASKWKLPETQRYSSDAEATEIPSENVNDVSHLYVLERGLTHARVADLQFSTDARLVLVTSSRGTCHCFAINPTGGAPSAPVHLPSYGNLFQATMNAHSLRYGAPVCEDTRWQTLIQSKEIQNIGAGSTKDNNFKNRSTYHAEDRMATSDENEELSDAETQHTKNAYDTNSTRSRIASDEYHEWTHAQNKKVAHYQLRGLLKAAIRNLRESLTCSTQIGIATTSRHSDGRVRLDFGSWRQEERRKRAEKDRISKLVVKLEMEHQTEQMRHRSASASNDNNIPTSETFGDISSKDLSSRERFPLSPQLRPQGVNNRYKTDLRSYSKWFPRPTGSGSKRSFKAYGHTTVTDTCEEYPDTPAHFSVLAILEDSMQGCLQVPWNKSTSSHASMTDDTDTNMRTTMDDPMRSVAYIRHLQHMYNSTNAAARQYTLVVSGPGARVYFVQVFMSCRLRSAAIQAAMQLLHPNVVPTKPDVLYVTDSYFGDKQVAQDEVSAASLLRNSNRAHTVDIPTTSPGTNQQNDMPTAATLLSMYNSSQQESKRETNASASQSIGDAPRTSKHNRMVSQNSEHRSGDLERLRSQSEDIQGSSTNVHTDDRSIVSVMSHTAVSSVRGTNRSSLLRSQQMEDFFATPSSESPLTATIHADKIRSRASADSESISTRSQASMGGWWDSVSGMLSQAVYNASDWASLAYNASAAQMSQYYADYVNKDGNNGGGGTHDSSTIKSLKATKAVLPKHLCDTPRGLAVFLGLFGSNDIKVELGTRIQDVFDLRRTLEDPEQRDTEGALNANESSWIDDVLVSPYSGFQPSTGNPSKDTFHTAMDTCPKFLMPSFAVPILSYDDIKDNRTGTKNGTETMGDMKDHQSNKADSLDIQTLREFIPADVDDVSHHISVVTDPTYIKRTGSLTNSGQTNDSVDYAAKESLLDVFDTFGEKMVACGNKHQTKTSSISPPGQNHVGMLAVDSTLPGGINPVLEDHFGDQNSSSSNSQGAQAHPVLAEFLRAPPSDVGFQTNTLISSDNESCDSKDQWDSFDPFASFSPLPNQTSYRMEGKTQNVVDQTSNTVPGHTQCPNLQNSDIKTTEHIIKPSESSGVLNIKLNQQNHRTNATSRNVLASNDKDNNDTLSTASSDDSDVYQNPHENPLIKTKVVSTDSEMHNIKNTQKGSIGTPTIKDISKLEESHEDHMQDSLISPMSENNREFGDGWSVPTLSPIQEETTLHSHGHQDDFDASVESNVDSSQVNNLNMCNVENAITLQDECEKCSMTSVTSDKAILEIVRDQSQPTWNSDGTSDGSNSNVEGEDNVKDDIQLNFSSDGISEGSDSSVEENTTKDGLQPESNDETRSVKSAIDTKKETVTDKSQHKSRNQGNSKKSRNNTNRGNVDRDEAQKATSSTANFNRSAKKENQKSNKGEQTKPTRDNTKAKADTKEKSVISTEKQNDSPMQQNQPVSKQMQQSKYQPNDTLNSASPETTSDAFSMQSKTTETFQSTHSNDIDVESDSHCSSSVSAESGSAETEGSYDQNMSSQTCQPNVSFAPSSSESDYFSPAHTSLVLEQSGKSSTRAISASRTHAEREAMRRIIAQRVKDAKREMAFKEKQSRDGESVEISTQNSNDDQMTERTKHDQEKITPVSSYADAVSKCDDDSTTHNGLGDSSSSSASTSLAGHTRNRIRSQSEDNMTASSVGTSKSRQSRKKRRNKKRK